MDCWGGWRGYLQCKQGAGVGICIDRPLVFPTQAQLAKSVQTHQGFTNQFESLALKPRGRE